MDNPFNTRSCRKTGVNCFDLETGTKSTSQPKSQRRIKRKKEWNIINPFFVLM